MHNYHSQSESITSKNVKDDDNNLKHCIIIIVYILKLATSMQICMLTVAT